MKRLAIIGASGHGKVIADIAKKNGYQDIVFLDDNESLKVCGDYPVIGKSSAARELEADIIVGIGNAAIRKRIQESLNEERIVTLIHPDAVIADNVTIGKGTVIMAGTVIGKGCIINTCASVDHDCRIYDFVHVSVGVHIAGTVAIGAETWIGAGATVGNNVKICGDCMIGAGAVVVQDIESSGTYIGVPAEEKRMFISRNYGEGGASHKIILSKHLSMLPATSQYGRTA